MSTENHTSTADAVRHLILARRHAGLALDAVLPERLRERRAAVRREARVVLRTLVTEALREASAPEASAPGASGEPEPTRPTRVTIE